jgi:hypothetical protein
MHIEGNVSFPVGNVSGRMGNEPFPARRIAFSVGNVNQYMGNKASAVNGGSLWRLCISCRRWRSPPQGLDNSFQEPLIYVHLDRLSRGFFRGFSSDGERAGISIGSRDSAIASGVESAFRRIFRVRPELIDNRWTLPGGTEAGPFPLAPSCPRQMKRRHDREAEASSRRLPIRRARSQPRTIVWL